MAKEQNEEWMTTSQVQRAIRKGNTDFADRLVGKVVLVRDANEDPFDQMSEFEKKQAIGVRKRVRELPLYDLSDLGKRRQRLLVASNPIVGSRQVCKVI